VHHLYNVVQYKAMKVKGIRPSGHERKTWRVVLNRILKVLVCSKRMHRLKIVVKMQHMYYSQITIQYHVKQKKLQNTECSQILPIYWVS